FELLFLDRKDNDIGGYGGMWVFVLVHKP
ncbi:MAG: hypothetical protein ACI909_003831, partial [Planctomycetota bacterium]